MADAQITIVPDILPVKLLRLAASSVWDRPDFVIGWYFQIWRRMATNESAPGYLDMDEAQLFRAAGARSREYFERHASRMLAENFKRDDLGRLYCPRLLEELKESRL